MKMIKMLAITGAGFAALTTSTAAMAQTSDNATVDAVATLEQVTPPLTVSVLANLDYGFINIPNGVVAGNQCSYDIRASVNPVMTVKELNSSGTTVDSTFPTPSNCENSGSFKPTRFLINCSPATPTTITYTLTSPLAGSGVVLTDSESTELAAVQSNGTTNFLNSSSSTIVPTCPDGTATGSAAGEFQMLVGGRLILDETATPGSDVTVGTVTLTATY